MKTTLMGMALAVALPASAADLMAAWQHSLQLDPFLMAAGAAREAGAEKSVQGDALLKPRVSLSAGINGVVAVPVMVVTMLLSTRRGVMGEVVLSRLATEL